MTLLTNEITNECDTDTSVTDQFKPKLRVLFISHTYVVGVNQGKLAAIAATREAIVGLLAPNPWKANQWDKYLFLENTYPEIQSYPVKVFFNGRSGAYVFSPLKLFQAIRSFQPDIIQIEEEVFSLSTFEVAILAKLLNKPIVIFGWENMDRQLSWPRSFIRQFTLNTSQLIIAGNTEGGELVKKWGFQKHIEVMPQMGVDTELFKPIPQQPENKILNIGFVGRLAHAKGLDTLLEAAQQLKSKGLSFRLVLCGSGPDETMFKQMAQDLDLESIVDWRGGVRHNEVPGEIANMDLLVLPSRSVNTWKEQFGHVLIEAMATGLPVVGSTCGEIPNVIGQPELVFPEENSEALAIILHRLLTEPVWRAEMSQYSLERVHKYYSHDRISQRLLDLWRTILDKHSPSEVNGSDELQTS